MSQQQRYGLLESDLREIIAAVETLPEVDQIILFGSRAKGTYKLGSDIDLAIKGQAVTYDRLSSYLLPSSRINFLKLFA